ncbi:MAG: hypothetical protein VKI83_09725 [Synechococcaceae cyanobacterium]|nr:hypothetical protein [Synechococcaceae cyanobacterium]
MHEAHQFDRQSLVEALAEQLVIIAVERGVNQLLLAPGIATGLLQL